jgi:hypothetical protein
MDERADCPALTRVERATYPTSPLVLAPAPRGDASRPGGWLFTSWTAVQLGGQTFSTPRAIGAELDAGDGKPPVLHLMSETRTAVTLSEGQQTSASTPMTFEGDTGIGCAVRVGTDWWLIDPIIGELHTTDASAGTLPREHWVGITRDDHGRVVLAAADQWLAIFDPVEQHERRRFPAVVWPSLGPTSGDCSVVVAGGSWYATFSRATSVLSVYDRRGAFVGHRRLDLLLGIGGNRILSLGARGRWLAVGYDNVVETLALEIGPECGNRRH